MLLEVIQPTGYSLVINSLRPVEHDCYLEIKHNSQFYIMTENFNIIGAVYWGRGSLTKGTQIWSFIKHCLYKIMFLFSLWGKTTCLERPQNLVVALCRFHCTFIEIYMCSWPQAVWKNFLFSKHNFEIIWFSGPFCYFCSPECIQIMIRGIFVTKWPIFQV